MIKQPRFLRKFDSNRDAHSNWEMADGLDWAWLYYGPDELAAQFRDARHLNASEAAKFELRLSLRDRIAHGEVLAFGIPVWPDFKNKAEQIPIVLFQSAHVNIDWEQETISGLGHEFHDLKVALRDESSSITDERIEFPNVTIEHAAEPIARAQDEAAVDSTREKRGGGRPSLYPKVKAVLDYIFENVQLRDERANNLLQPFNIEFKKRFGTPISERNLRDHLKRYRHELAETGNK